MANAFFYIQPFLIVVSTIVICILPGWALTLRFDLDPNDRPIIIILTGFALMYLFEFWVYLLSLPSWLPFSILLIGSLLYLLNYSHKKPMLPLKSSFPWVEVIVWLILSLWLLAIQFKIVVYGAQLGWAVDWREHYERSLFFLEQLPPETTFIDGMWQLSARAPLFNSIAGLLMGGLGKDFWVYQIIASVLNAFPVICLALLFQNISRAHRIPSLILSCLIFALAPFAVQQEIYPWTKMFTTGFILVGIYFYVKGAKQGDIKIMAWAFVPFALGVLAHFMTVLFAVFFLVHFIFIVLKNRWKIRPLIYPFALSIFLLSTWFVFLIMNFGITGAFTGNSTLGEKYTENFHLKHSITMSFGEVLWANTLTTLVPYSLRHDWKGPGRSPDPIKLGWQLQPKDFSPEEIELNRQVVWKLDLINNQSTLPGNIGWSGFTAFLTALMLYVTKRVKSENIILPSTNTKNISPGSFFWITFFICGIFINLYSLKIYSPQGMSYISFQPFLLLFAVFLFKWLQNSSKTIQVSLISFFLVESAFKTYIWIQMHARPIAIENGSDSDLVIRGPGLNGQYVNNYLGKVKAGTFYLSDRFGHLSDLYCLVALCLITGILVLAYRYWINVAK